MTAVEPDPVSVKFPLRKLTGAASGMRFALVQSRLALLQSVDDVEDSCLVLRVARGRIHAGSGAQVVAAHVAFDEA